MKLSVIIVNYNVKYFLEQALLSVRKAARGIDMEVWVVDNNSVDGSVEMVTEKFPEVRLISNKENTGFSKANNQAIKLSSGEYILLLNPDTVVEESTFQKCIEFMDAHPDAGGLGVRMIDGSGKFLPESKRGLPTPAVAFYKMSGLSALFPNSKIFGRYHLKYLDEFKTSEVEILAGAFMLMRKSVLDITGWLDETFFMYGEDIDLSYRIIKAGYKNYYFPETTIIHYKGESTKKSSVNYVFVFYKAMVIFAQKHYGGGKARLFSAIINTAIWLRASVALVWRFYERSKFLLVDLLLLFGINWYVKFYWENNHKYVEGGEYPDILLYLNIPLYVGLWALFIWLNNGYKKNSGIKPVIKGMLSGTVAIAVVYAFLPGNLRFSRALIILGSLGGTAVLVGYRMVLQFLKNKSISFETSTDIRTVIVGEEEEVLRVSELIRASGGHHVVIGFVGCKKDPTAPIPYLGKPDQLREIVRIFNVDEVVFCNKDISSESIIRMMSHPGMQDVNYKIVPEKSLYIIGSNSKDSQGELYTINLRLNLSDPDLRFQKRVFDFFSSIFLILFFPLYFFIKKSPLFFLKDLFNVLIGRMTMVGYHRSEESKDLPGLKPSLFSILSGFQQTDESVIKQANFFYARDYSVVNDVEVVLRSFWK